MKKLSFALFLLILFSSSYCLAQDPNTFRSILAGLEIKKPADWFFISSQNVDSIEKLSDEPLVVIARHKEPYYINTNPTVKIIFRQNPQLGSPVDMINLSISTIKALAENPEVSVNPEDNNAVKELAKGFEVIEEPRETTVCGLNAGYARFKNSADSSMNRMWVIEKGDYLFLMSMNGPAAGPEVSEDEFKRIFESIKIEK